jgi:hypothetical protein
MTIRITEFHAADAPSALNTEWLIVENTGDKPFSTKNCTLAVSRGGRPKQIGTPLDPGFVVAPGEKVRVITGNPGKKAHGKVPEDGVRNYFLFHGEPVLRGNGTIVAVTLRTHELARAVYDPDAPGGVKATGDAA